MLTFVTSFKYSLIHTQKQRQKPCFVKHESASVLPLVSCPLSRRPFVGCKSIWSAVMKEVTEFVIFFRGKCKVTRLSPEDLIWRSFI